ncbi:hypothetical protein HK104_005673 [Borealophlyctis nickersoniae]|nr:hypothetical protein HK104_005673 [Borealophlyctis nickersoniae]
MTDEAFQTHLNPFASALALHEEGIPVESTVPYFPSEDLFAADENDSSRLTPKELVYLPCLQQQLYMRLSSGARVSPLEVANILKQVQFVPSDAYLIRTEKVHPVEDREEAEPPEPSIEGSEEEDDEQVDPYGLTDDTSYTHIQHEVSAVADASGYLMRNGYHDDATKPPFQLPPLDGSTWATVGELARLEGFTAPWKGQTAAWLYDIGENLVSPNVESLLIDSFNLRDDSISTAVSCQTVIGVILSPLELVRTRLVVQTKNPYHQKYKGTFNCLRIIVEEEGLMSLYFGRHFVPTIVYHGIVAFFKFSTELIVENVFNVSAETQPLAFALCEFAVNVVQLGITMPLETIRRRLQCQIVSSTPGEKAFETVVERSVIPYTGMADCAWRIVTEEGGTRRQRGRKGSRKPKSWWSSWGLRGLYKGFKVRLVAQATLMILNAVLDGLEISEDVQ